MNQLYIALIHYPVFNKQQKVVTTAVTNFDLHDLSRNAATYGVKRLFIITPSEVQLGMVRYIKDYWVQGAGATYNPTRKQAFEALETCADLEGACLAIQNLSGERPLVVATTARNHEKSIDYDVVRSELRLGKSVLLAFGTGYGLVPAFLESADYVLKPIAGITGYNHLPVRSAVAVILDRLVGR